LIYEGGLKGVNDEDPLIVILYNEELAVPYGEAKDLIALQDTASVAVHLNQALASCGYRTIPIAVRDSLEELKESLKPFSPETAFVFNFCDGFRGNNKAATKVIRLIEKLGFKHTGSSADTSSLCIDKGRAKERLMVAGIPTPSFQVYTQPVGAYRYKLPAIVKPCVDDASIGIDLDSVVTTPDELLNRVAYVIERYCQPALVEEFISGRELSVSMWGNRHVEMLPITEHDYSLIPNPLNRILSYDAKWVPESFYFKNVPARCPADMDTDDKYRVADAALRAYRAVGLRDLGRVDIRYQNQIPYIIDINEIPDLAPASGFPNAAMKAGYSYAGMVEHILRLAMQRERWQWPQLTLNSLSPQTQMVQAF
jgi:D-alanine-D-alanine ligase